MGNRLTKMIVTGALMGTGAAILKKIFDTGFEAGVYFTELVTMKHTGIDIYKELDKVGYFKK